MTGKELRSRRQKLGLTQAQLGQALRRPQATISRWESGQMQMENADVLRFLLRALEDDRCQFPDQAAWIDALPGFLSRGD